MLMLTGCNSGGTTNNSPKSTEKANDLFLSSIMLSKYNSDCMANDNNSRQKETARSTAKTNSTQYKLVETVPNDINLPLATNAIDSTQGINDLLSLAKTKIDIEAYYFDNQAQSEFNQKIMQTLENKAKSGVEIRIIIEAKMYDNSLIKLGNLTSYPNVHIVKNDYFNSINGIVHAKLIVVDNTSFFIGSQNLDWIAFSLNHEVGVVLTNPALATQLEQVFNDDFSKNPIYQENNPNSITPAPAAGNVFIATSPNFPGIPSEIDNIIRLINNAKSTIDIQAMQIENYDSYSKSYWYQLQDALVNAAKRNVNVHIMMSNWEFEPWNVNYNNEFLSEMIKTPNIQVRYSVFPQLQGTNLCIPHSKVDHAKFMIVDSENSWIGTGNLSKNYFAASRNFSVFILNDQNFGRNLSSAFENVWQSDYASNYYTPITSTINPGLCTL